MKKNVKYSFHFKCIYHALLFVIFFICPQILVAQLKPAGVFGNNLILQQGIKIPIWGKAKPGSIVEVSLANQSGQVITDENGKWIVYLPKMKADGQTYKLNIKSGLENITYDNILLGEVWVASGQSNMAYQVEADLQNKADEIKNANYPNIRFRIIDNVTSIVPLDDTPQNDWKVCNPQNIKNFSAVAYFFARSLHMDQKVPVGVIVSARGATSIESWISKERLMTYPDFKEEINKVDYDSVHWNELVAKSKAAEANRELIARTSFVGLKMGVTKLKFDDSNWEKTSFPITCEKMGYRGYWGMIWVRKTFNITEAQLKKSWGLYLPIKDQNDIVYLNEKQIAKAVSKLENKVLEIPSNLLNVGLNVLVIRMYVNWGTAEIGDRNSNSYLQSTDGEQVILSGDWMHNNKIEPSVASWQGYYNKSTVNFNGMINPLIPYGIKGFLWYQGESNASRALQYADLQAMLIDDWRIRWQQGYIPYLYVQLANYKARSEKPLGKDDWAALRDAQRSTLTRSINTGMACTIDIGDEYNIHPANKQDVGKRLYMAAQEKVYHQHVIGFGPIFQRAKAEGGIVRVSFSYSQNGLKTNGNLLEKCFALADETGNWFWADAKIEGQQIILTSKEVLRPTQVQYAWQSNPVASVYNSSGLPMLPFNEKLSQ